MWTRSMLKERAKMVLSLNYWKAFAVSLVLLFAGGRDSRWNGSNGGRDYSVRSGPLHEFAATIALYAGIIIIIFIVLRVFVGYILEVGGRKFFVRAAEGESDMGHLGYGFQEERYFNIVGTMLLRSIYTFLWTLLLIIPGIIKSYAYRMVPYILADNPSIGYNRAIELSNEMTQGQKFDMFVLDLSFIGWYILGTLAFFIGVLFVQPYEDATNAELYLILRRNAIERGLTSYEELNIPVLNDYMG